DIRHTSVVENALLELTEGRRAEAVLPEPACGVEQIEMRFVDGELAADRHDEARSQQRQIERLAVVRAARAERLELALQMLDECRLGTEVAQHVLPKDELAIAQVHEADEKDVRARATGKTGGLRVEEQDVAPRAGRLALQTEVRQEERIARSPSDD